MAKTSINPILAKNGQKDCPNFAAYAEHMQNMQKETCQANNWQKMSNYLWRMSHLRSKCFAQRKMQKLHKICSHSSSCFRPKKARARHLTCAVLSALHWCFWPFLVIFGVVFKNQTVKQVQKTDKNDKNCQKFKLKLTLSNWQVVNSDSFW